MVVKGHLICLPRSQGNPNNGTERVRSPFLWPLLWPGVVLCMPKGLRKLPLPKAAQGNSSKAMRAKKVNLDFNMLLSKWLQKFS